MQNTTEGKSALGLDGNVTALIGYIIPLVALILVFMEKDNKFVRFHSIQSLLYSVAITIVMIALVIFSVMLAFISGTLATLFSLIWLLIWLGVLAGALFLAYKAYQGQMFKLPVIGDMADKWT
ncbi:MAG: DUF4870 domain-containing protein [Acidobacteriota bacterium]